MLPSNNMAKQHPDSWGGGGGGGGGREGRVKSRVGGGGYGKADGISLATSSTRIWF